MALAVSAAPHVAAAGAPTPSETAEAASRAANAVRAGAAPDFAVVASVTGARIQIFEGATTPAPGSGFTSTFDGQDQVAVGNVIGDDGTEIVIAEGGSNNDGGLTVYDLAGERVPEAEFGTAFDETDVLMVGDVAGDENAEIIVVNRAGGRVDMFDAATHQPIEHSGFDTTFNDDSTSGAAIGDVDDDGKDEVLIANRSGGRIDVLNPRTGEALGDFGIPDTTFNDDDGTEFAVGDVDADGDAEVLIANAHPEDLGRIDVLSPRPGESLGDFGVANTTFEDTSENQFKVADVDGDGRVEALVANAEHSGRIDVLDLRTHGPKDGFGVSTTAFGDTGMLAVSRFDPAGQGSGDLDGDRIPDDVERFGITDDDGDVVLDLTDVAAQDAAYPNRPAHPCRKDIVVEMDWMAEEAASSKHDHKPTAAAMNEVVQAFANAPVDLVPDCPYPDAPADGGINLIIRVEEGHVTEETPLGLPDRFNEIKSTHFDHAIDPYVHWVLWAHDAGNFGGRVDPGDADAQDLIITVDRCVNPRAANCDADGSRGGFDAQASTFMHELGHSIGLHHGGGVDDPDTAADERETNCKPNYLSIMSYFFSNGLRRDVVNPDGTVSIDSFHDFSHRDLADLAESGPVESDGIGSGSTVDGVYTKWGGGAGSPLTAVAGDPDGIDWNDDKDYDDSVPIDLNDNTGALCDSAGADDTLTGFDDWAFLNDGIGSWDEDAPPVELTTAQSAALTASWDAALFPDTTTALDAPRAGFVAGSSGVAVNGDRVYATHAYRTAAIPQVTDRKGSLVVLDRTSMTVLQRVQVGFNPRSVAVNPVTNRVYVANGGDGRPENFTVSVLDATTLQRIADVPIGQGPVDVAVNTRINRVYVSNWFQRQVHVIDGATNTQLAPVPVGPGPMGLAVDESTNTVHVALSNRSFAPFRAALGTFVDDGVNPPQVLEPVSLGDPLLQPIDLTVNPASGRIYIAGIGGGGIAPSVTVMDASRTQVARLTTIGPARAITVNPDAGKVFVASQNSVEVIHDSHLEIVRRMPLGGASFAIATEAGPGRQLWVGDIINGTVTRLSYSSGAVVG